MVQVNNSVSELKPHWPDYYDFQNLFESPTLHPAPGNPSDETEQPGIFEN